MKVFLIGFIILMLGGVALGYVAKAGLYPVAIVSPPDGGSKLVWAKTLNRATAAALNYYRQMGARPGLSEIKQIRQATLDKIIENLLISKKLEELGDPGIKAIPQQVIEKYGHRPELAPAAAAIYGLGLAEFYELILIPQAQREWLQQKLAAEGGQFEDWLTREQQAASIIILKK